jgi:lipoprotein-anchoring transpeptidase ErfK/SrfK
MMRKLYRTSTWAAAAIAASASACIVSESSDSAKKTDTGTVAATAQEYVADSVISVPAYDSVYMDTVGLGQQIGNLPPLSTDTGFKRISSQTTGATISKFPARIPTRGPAALQLQILLDRAGFSPGIIDGQWGPNAAKALQWFNVRNGMDSTGVMFTDSQATKPPRQRGSTKANQPVKIATIDQATYQKLATAGQNAQLIASYQVTAEDVKGPFVKVPNSVYEQAKLDCLCYSSPGEALAEKFHTSEQMLQQLNPGVDFKSIAAGASIQVPNVAQSQPATGGGAAKIVISRKGYWTHVVDASGNVVAHFPSTLGAGYDPSPSGDFKVTGISHNPAFNYQPSLMAEVPDTRPTAKLKPGPNSPVGIVWMALSKPHYGIHGTSAPETIGYANSHGCVRLTNWDAEILSGMVKAGTPVEFVD